MRILLLGGGGREHALAWKFLGEGHEVTCAPGNPGIAASGAACVPLDIVDATAVIACARTCHAELVVVGPEAPLVAGVADALRAAGFAVFGPGADGAQLEASKAFSKQFFARHGIATAPFFVCATFDEAAAAIASLGGRVVVKADGLAAGKGVVVCDDAASAHEAAREMLDGRFGDAGLRLVIEARLQGREVSLLAITDGKDLCVLPATEDHKSIYDGDRGPNTGGMGTVSPAWVSEALVARAIADVLRPTLAGLAAEGIDYRGVLYAGLMVTPDGTPWLLEYNCRFGDPETQPIMMRWVGNAGELLAAAAAKTLASGAVTWRAETAVCVIVAAPGYPASPRLGEAIGGRLASDARVQIFHAGTRAEGARLVTSGGRVFAVTALGADVHAARAAAYGAADQIEFAGKQLRRDIGLRPSAALFAGAVNAADDA
ncbi:MAG: phosphoribosylamine--glycine ligase [Myxococcales bacterium]|nr:phosphoribosylamine--glycine ligase [Myxococcales bacterium]